MGLSLRKGYGLDNKSLSGDFASKMWSSYIQLNPGVYSDAIATEFKRRMKPDYVDSAGTGYYYTTFGPSGLNKTTADWIGIMVTDSATIVKTNTKTGATIKWNMDGTIVTQNNLPAYTKNANAGIITFTSTDGFGGVTAFDCSQCNLSHLSGLSSFVNIASLICFNNKLTLLTTYQWSKLTTFGCSGNLLTSLTTYSWPLLVTFNCSGNLLVSLLNTGTRNISVDNESFNLYPTTAVDSRLSYWNSVLAATPPVKNLNINLSGATMGIPTGAGSNPDYLGIIAKVQAAGFIPTISTRTS